MTSTQSAPPARAPRFAAVAVMPALLLAVALVLGIVSLGLLLRSNHVVERDHAASIQLERVLSSLKDVESGARGYLLTGRPVYLEPYTRADAALDAQMGHLRSLGVDDPALSEAVRERRDSSARAIATLKEGGRDNPVAAGLLDAGRMKMDRVRALVDTGQGALDRDIASEEARQRLIFWPLGVTAFALTVAAFGLIARVASHRRRAQQASANLLRDIMENAPVGLAVMDRALQLRHVNRAFAAVGAAPDTVVPGAMLWSVLPQMRGDLEARIARVLGSGRPTSADVAMQVVEEGVARTRAFQVVAFPFDSLTGAVADAGIGLVVSDVTARRRAEQRLAESEVRFRTLTETSTAIVWTASPEGSFDKPQPRWATFTGQSEDALRGRGWVEAVAPEDRAETLSTWSHALAVRGTFSVEHRLRRADGAWRYMAVLAVPVLNDEGVVREWIGSHTDITDRKRAEAELSAAKTAAESANRAKSAFLANMSHELRTPLSAVIGYTEMLEEEMEEAGQADLLGDVVKIKSNARHLLGLINDVLDLSKIEANKMDTFAETIDIGAMVTEVAGTVHHLVRQKNNVLAIVAPPDLGTMLTDVVKLRQCLLNLLSNAAKFTEGGRIVLSVERAGTGSDAAVTFRVADTGIGMTPAQVERLFQRFTQADDTTTRRFGGTGLGLALTKAFSRLLGGDITVASVVDEGTTFTLTLPAGLPAAIAADPPLSAGEEAARGDVGGRNVVLVIDDDAAHRDLIVRFLERQGFGARTAADGVSGLQLARAVRPRAILLDVMMPRMDGWHVLNTLKADPELGGTPVIMVTFTSDKGLSRTLGAAEHLSKPLDWNELQHVMDRLRDGSGDILVVDDDPDLRQRLRSVLERQGMTVREAANGQDAIAAVLHGPPRAILLDLTMPVMDGFTFLHTLRDLPGHRDTPVIVFTARDLSAAERHDLRQADKVLSKTVGLKDVVREIARVAPPTPTSVSE